MGPLLRMAGLRDLRRDDDLSDVFATVLGDGMSLSRELIDSLNWASNSECAVMLEMTPENAQSILDEVAFWKKVALERNIKLHMQALYHRREMKRQQEQAADDYMALLESTGDK